MANATSKQVNVICKESLRILENTLVMHKKVHVDYKKEFDQRVNGFKKGSSVTIQRPADFEVTDGAALSKQDVVEGSTTMTVNTQKHVAVEFTSQELTQDIDESGIRERVLQPAMLQLANKVDMAIMDLYKYVPQWVGTPGQTLNSFSDFAKGPERMDEMGVPIGRCAVLSPADYWGMVGSQTALSSSDKLVNKAYTMAKLGNIGDVEAYMAQNIPTHTVGTKSGTPLVNGGAQGVAYTTAKDTTDFTSSLVTDGWGNSETVLTAGDVFTIAGVYAVNPVTKATLPFLRQFTVTADATSNGSGAATLTVSPAIIATGSQKTVSAVPADNAAITVMGTASTGYRQNLMFHKNAFAFVSAPLAIPPAVYNGARESYKGINLRLIPFYDEDTDKAGWRFDILFGTKALDPRLAVRASGTA